MIGILIINYNNWEDTINCIESVERYNTFPIKYIVIDNGSTRDGCVDALDHYFNEHFKGCYTKKESNKEDEIKELSYITLIVSKVNLGYAKGNNLGLGFIERDDSIKKVLVLNNDVLFTSDILLSLSRMQDETQQCASISPVLYKKDGITYDYNCARKNPTNWSIILRYLFLYRNIFGYLKRQQRKEFLLYRKKEYEGMELIPIDLPSGSCMLLDKKLFKTIGWFDPGTFLYYEENILYKKIDKLGYQNYLMLNC